MVVLDPLYENEKLFQRFFERKSESDWSRAVSWITNEKEIIPHMDMVYSDTDNDYLIKANYKLSDYDRSIINTYFMDGGQAFKIRSIIGEYLSTQPKRRIDENIEIDENDLMVGKCITAEIIASIWESYIKVLIEH